MTLESLLDILQFFLQLVGLCIDILPLRVHEQPQTLTIIIVALTEDDLFEDTRQLLLHMHVRLLTQTCILLLQQGLDGVKALLSLEDALLIAGWRSHHQVRCRIQWILLCVLLCLTKLLRLLHMRLQLLMMMPLIIHSKVT